MTPTARDCIIIGGGPAGLTAATYIARFHLSVVVFDDGASWAAQIPVSHNQSGFPGGIKGPQLLDRMRQQALNHGAELRPTRVNALSRVNDNFVVATEDTDVTGRTVLLATGVLNRPPTISKATHDDALHRGLIRYCPVCDGFEVTDKRIAVIGNGERAFREALFLRSYSKEIMLLTPSEADEFAGNERARLEELGIGVDHGPLKIDIENDKIQILTRHSAYRFDTAYPALGSDIRSELAVGLGARLSSEGCISVDGHQRTNVSGLYAAGDVVIGLDQISHAVGQAALAATAIRNDLTATALLIR